MKRIVITPTFRPHFPFNREFLQSYEQNVADARDIAVHFVVARDEIADLRAMLKEFPALDLHVHAFEDLLRLSGHEEESQALLHELGKFTFQSLKKLYALKALPYDQAMVLDSEALVLKPTRLGDVFDEYFADPYVLYSDLSHRGEFWFGGLSDAATRNAGKLLRMPYPNVYYMEYYGWFYEKSIVQGLFAAFPEDLLPAIRTRLRLDKRVFENVLYYSFLRAGPDAQRYRFVSVNEMLREYLGDEGYAEYMREFQGSWEQVGIFEHVSKALTDRNLPALTRLFQEKTFRFYRFELHNRNERVQHTLVERSPITFLVSSENYRRTRERVAVCLSGKPRNYRQNLKFMRSFLADSGADVFFHFWESPDQELIVQSLEPKAHVFESPTLAGEALPVKHRERFTTPERDRNVASMLYSISRANELRREYEEKNGFRYDVVVRLRLDFFSTSNLTEILARIRAEQGGWERTLYVPDMAHSLGINDQIALGSSDTMDAYASLFGVLGRIAAEEYFNPEYFLLRHVLAKGLRIRTFPFEYVLLRDDDVATFDLETHIRNTRTTWWSAQLPEIPQGALNEYFSAKADSVLLIAQMELETPKVFRLQTSRGYLRLDPSSEQLRFTSQAADASLFFLIIAGNEDRTALNIRCRDLVLDGRGAVRDDAVGGNLCPDARGIIRTNGASDAHSAFFIARKDDGFVFEWRPGFWKSPADRRLDKPRAPGGDRKLIGEEYRGGQRLFLRATSDGLALAPSEAGGECFQIEYVKDEAAEKSGFGVQAPVRTSPAVHTDPLLVRLLWRSYLAARVFEQRGTAALVNQSMQFIRRRSYLAVRSQEQNGRSGLVNRTIRFLRKHL